MSKPRYPNESVGLRKFSKLKLKCKQIFVLEAQEGMKLQALNLLYKNKVCRFISKSHVIDFFLCFRLFRESEEDDALIFDELIRTNPTFTVFNNSSAQKLRQSKFHATGGSRGGNNYSSSFRCASQITITFSVIKILHNCKLFT